MEKLWRLEKAGNELHPAPGPRTMRAGTAPAEQGIAAMKKRTVSAHEIPKTAGKTKRPSTVRAAQSAATPAPGEPHPPTPARAAQKSRPQSSKKAANVMPKAKSIPAQSAPIESAVVKPNVPVPSEAAGRPQQPPAASVTKPHVPAPTPSAEPLRQTVSAARRSSLPQPPAASVAKSPVTTPPQTAKPSVPAAIPSAEPLRQDASAANVRSDPHPPPDSPAASSFLPQTISGEESKVEEVNMDSIAVVRQTLLRKGKTAVPSILLEGDEPSAPAPSGPGQKFSLGATPPAQSFSGGELPDSYGTRKLFLTARDPHWLYATWDLTAAQQKELNAASSDGHLILRIYAGKIEGHPAYEIHVHPESRHWFAHVERAGNSYAAELGYYSALGKWMRVSVSSGTLTPPDAASPESEADFATIPFEFPFAKLMQIIEEAVRDNLPLAVAIEELRRHGHPDLPRFSSSGFSSVAPAPSGGAGPAAETAPSRTSGAAAPSPGKAGSARVWTPEQEKALARIINIDQTRRVWMGSLEITELVRRRLAHEVTSPVTAFGVGVPGIVPAPVAGPSGGSSPMGGQGDHAKGFWFNVNAELVIYGATEPNAKITLGGHEIKLRADGTFSFRFALPDGKYDLPAVAVSADGTDGRAAELKFSRTTEYLGDVGATPPDPALKPPLAGNH